MPMTSSLLADSNRDGVVDQNDAAGKQAWTAQAGALFLANLDDDDGKGKADATDAIVNGPDDEKDLARIKLTAWPSVAATATGTITVEPALAAQSTHLFRHDGSAWSIAGALSYADLVAGVEFGIEATTFSVDAGSWDGYAVVHLVVTDGPKTIADDKVVLRVAPFVMVNNLSDLGAVWVSTFDDPGGTAFKGDVGALAMGVAAVENEAVTPDPQGDQWAEDWWQVGVTFIPATDGPHGMLVAQRSAQPDRPAGGFAAQQLGKDFAFIWPHTDSQTGQADGKGYSLDSFGDHDTIPPYSKDGQDYPLGRIFIGGSDAHHIDPVVRAFYDAQKAQPVFQVDTTWLFVGHVDEIFSFVPAATPRGWKLLVASPRLARTMLQSLADGGMGGVKMFVGESFLDANGNPIPADITVSALLADADIMAASEAAQTNIDADVAALKAEVGLDDGEIVEMPFLFERVSGGATYEYVAHMPGTVNLRSLDGAVGIARPHGPMVNGADLFEKDLLDRLGSPSSGLGKDGMGLKITFVEDWDDYHVLDGEVHCGSTSAARTMPAARWWEAGR